LNQINFVFIVIPKTFQSTLILLGCAIFGEYDSSKEIGGLEQQLSSSRGVIFGTWTILNF